MRVSRVREGEKTVEEQLKELTFAPSVTVVSWDSTVMVSGTLRFEPRGLFVIDNLRSHHPDTARLYPVSCK